MRRASSTVLAGTLALGAATLACAAETPRQTYDHYVGCAATMMALQTDVSPGTGAKLDEISKAMRDKASAAAVAAGVPADRVPVEIEQRRDRLAGELKQPDAAKAKDARGEIGRASLICAFDELEKTMAARGNKPAATKGK